MRATIGKLVAAGYSRHVLQQEQQQRQWQHNRIKDLRRGKARQAEKGATNTFVEEEGNADKTETIEDVIPTRGHLLQMLGITNAVISCVNSPEEPATKAEGCWDSNTPAILVFNNIQVRVRHF